MFIRIVACAWALLCSLTATAEITSLPTPSVDYSADRRIEMEAGTFTGKVYAAGGKERTELEAAGMQTVMILRPDLQLGWMLMPTQRTYQKLDFGKAREQAGAPAADVKISRVGDEMVEGHATAKYKLVMKDGSAGGFMWFTEQGIAVKMDLLMKEGRKKSRMTMTLQNLQVGPQDPAHFEVPEGYAKMPAGGLFGAMGAMGGNRPATTGSQEPGLGDAAMDGAKSGLRNGVASGLAAGVADGVRGLFRR